MNEAVQVRPFNHSSSDETSIKEIFYLTSVRKTFENQKEKEEFYQKWMLLYLKDSRCGILVAVNGEDTPVGYTSYCLESDKVPKSFSSKILGYDLFFPEYKNFPAHLHINCHPQFQGKGVGKMLILKLVDHLKEKGCPGLHLITDPNASNVQFYEKMGFSEKIKKSKKQYSFLLMGKKL